MGIRKADSQGIMETRPFGSTGQSVPAIGLGGGHLNARCYADGLATVRRALELGVNYFDTAPAYERGASQVILGEALEGSAQPHLLATKLGYMATPADFRSPDALRAQLWESLRALRRSKVDILQVHMAEWECWWKDGSSQDQLLNPEEAYDFADAPVMQVLREARERGICRFIGITADRSEELAHVLRHVEVDSCLVAYDYTLLSRRAGRTALPLAREKGVAYVAAALLQPYLLEVHPEWLSAPPPGLKPEMQHRLGRLYELQKECGLSLVTLSVRYVLADPAVSTILVGAATCAELEESVAAAEAGPLPSDLQEALENIGLP